jgi:AraC family transcriptional regulator
MHPVQKALWYVEHHSRNAITLEVIAAACKVSPSHLTRAFAAATGLSLMRYVRARRLSEAARQLAQGADDILSLALETGYGSHEAFTRAFRDQFALTPEQLRAQGQLNGIKLVEAIAMNATPASELPPPRFETLKSKTFVGLVERYNCQSPAGIPDQWQRFASHLGTMPGRVGDAAYGVCYNFDSESNFDYMCGVEVAGSPALPRGIATLRVPEQRYAVFTHRGHIAGIRTTLAAIWRDWFSASRYQVADTPTFERYGPEFNPTTGLGGVEIWVPIEGENALPTQSQRTVDCG